MSGRCFSSPCEASTDARHQRRNPQRLLENPDYPVRGMACLPPELLATLGKGLQAQPPKAPGTHAAGCSNGHDDHNGMPDYLDLVARSALSFLPLPGIGSLLLKSSSMTTLRPVSGLIADPPARE
jgi:hypothetical protein